MRTLIVVPARYGSTRFPGKPLAEINGISMVRRTARIAQKASEKIGGCDYVVATDHEEIKAHCQTHNIPALMTDKDLPTGSDRAHAAGQLSTLSPDIIINLQGDAPFTPVDYVTALGEALKSGADVATPYVQLSWTALDALRQHKKATPFSGTCVIIGPDNQAIWFSKNIIPAIRKEPQLRESSDMSPVCRHVGLYAYKREALEQFVNWPESHFEKLEGLEQLRLLENGLSITCVKVAPPKIATPGIDTPEDLALAERLLREHGDPFS